MSEHCVHFYFSLVFFSRKNDNLFRLVTVWWNLIVSKKSTMKAKSGSSNEQACTIVICQNQVLTFPNWKTGEEKIHFCNLILLLV